MQKCIVKLKSRKVKNKQLYMSLNEDDFRQGLDYSYVLLVAFTCTMEQCKVLKNSDIFKAYELACETMHELYQLIGRESAKSDKRIPRKRSKKRKGKTKRD